MSRGLEKQFKKLELILLSNGCPEQYDVLIDGERAGYLRLRHGCLRANYPDFGGERVYQAEPTGDGIFDDGERGKYIGEALTAIINRHEAEIVGSGE
jgi:hypothetical protein